MTAKLRGSNSVLALETRLYSSARDIAAAEWSSLSSGVDARLDRAFFDVVERAGIYAEPLYLCLRTNETIRAVAPCLFAVEDDSTFASYKATDVLLRPEEVRGADVPQLARDELHRVAPALRALRPLRTLSVVVPFSRYAPVGELFWSGPETFERLVTELDALAVKRGATLWAILGVPAGAPLLAAGQKLGLLPALLSADTVMEAPWSSLDEYVAALPGRRRTLIRKELRAASERYTIAHEPDIEGVFSELVRLSVSQQARYGVLRRRPILIAELAHAFGEGSRILGARRDGKLIAYTMLLRRGNVVQVFGYGADHRTRERGDFLWSNVAMYAPIADVVAHGGGTLRWGPTNYEAKLLRGSRLEPMWGLYRPLEASVEAALDAYLGPFNRLQEAHYDALRRYTV